MKGKMILISVLSLLMLGVVVQSVMAIGPSKAAEVGNNPHLSYVPFAGGVMAFLDTPYDNSVLWVTRTEQPDFIFFLLTASKGQGRMNNAIIASGTNWLDIISNPPEYANKWIYLSGPSGTQWDAPFDDGTPFDVGPQCMFYWQLRAMGMPHATAYADALLHPDGVYRQLVRTHA